VRHIDLRQHMFPQRNAGRLYLDGFRVPMRGDLEAALLRLLRRCLDDLRARPAEPTPAGSDLDGLAGQGTVMIGQGMADLFAMPESRRQARYVECVIGYVESEWYGTVTDEFEPSSGDGGIVLIRPDGSRQVIDPPQSESR
jgi:hypothetical protein